MRSIGRRNPQSHGIEVPRAGYTIPAGYESRESPVYKSGVRFHSFDCVDNGTVQKTLSRMRAVYYDFDITYKLTKIRNCGPTPGGGGTPF